jgi:membrane protein required for colicin V production
LTFSARSDFLDIQTWFDGLLIFLILFSIVMSVIRGFVVEAIALFSWILGFWLAFARAKDFVAWVPAAISDPGIRLLAAFLLILILVLTLGALVNFLFSFLIRGKLLRWLDHGFGVIFGFVRGVVLAAVIILLLRLTPFIDSPWWQQSAMVPKIMPLTLYFENLVPEAAWQKYMLLEESPAATAEDDL